MMADMDDHHPDAVTTALASALSSATLTAADGAARTLAETYARNIDAGGDLSKLGPGFLATLAALGMTPAARAALAKKAAPHDHGHDQLGKLRARNAARSG